MRRISTFPMTLLLALSILAAATSARACRMVPEPGGGYKYVCEGPSPPPIRIRRYGAIAYSPSGGSYGYSSNFADRADAETRALKECGKDDCVIATWFFNHCGALATSSNGSWGADQAASEQGAQALAQARCVREGGSNCKIMASQCAF